MTLPMQEMKRSCDGMARLCSYTTVLFPSSLLLVYTQAREVYNSVGKAEV